MSGLSTLSNIGQKWAGASQNVIQAIQGASLRTGVSFDYLMDKARQESSFDADAKAKTSSASGLFQFIESTWLNAVKTYGDQFGLGDLSSKISIDGAGRAHVADAATKQQILKLRDNPEVASDLVAAMTKDNASYLESSLGGKVGQTDLYLAHFLGLGGADKFLKAKQANPLKAAADLFPAAAHANKNVFYNANGTKRSLDQVYDFFAQKMGESNGDVTPVVTGTMTAQAAKPNYPVPAVVQNHNTLTATAYLPDFDQPSPVNAQWAQSQMMDILLKGFKLPGTETAQKNLGGTLLTPYTSFVLSKMNSPDEKTKKNDLFN